MFEIIFHTLHVCNNTILSYFVSDNIFLLVIIIRIIISLVFSHFRHALNNLSREIKNIMQPRNSEHRLHR